MKITNEAKLIVENILKENNCSALHVSIVKGCCGPSVYLAIGNPEENQSMSEVNGINVIITPEAVERAQGIVISEKEGQLILEDAMANC